MTRTLVVTADDFGLTDGVNRAILRGHREGIVTSASLLAVAQAYRGAVELAKQAPRLAVGVHLAIVGEDPPLLPAVRVRSLVDRTGNFPLTYPAVLSRAALGRLDPDDVRREFRAQIERVLGDGLPISHLDTHQHLHLWPVIGKIVTELATEFGIPAVRLPRSHRPGPVGVAVNALAARLRVRLDRAGLVHSADYAGLDEAGAMDLALPAAIARLSRRGRPTAEINAHPGEADDPRLERFCWGYRWPLELAALTSPETAALVEASSFRLVSWADLAPRTQGLA
jgi:chitin disaccharide deacetylase